VAAVARVLSVAVAGVLLTTAVARGDQRPAGPVVAQAEPPAPAPGAAGEPAPTAPAAPTDPAAPSDPAAPDVEPAQPVEPSEVVEPTTLIPEIRIHGFVSEGGFVSTANEYIGASSRGSLALFEAGLNVSTQLTDRLQTGIQLFSRTVGDLRDDAPRIDWAVLDYRWRDWLGMRGGVIKMPFGLYNEYADIDAARLSILLPQSIYPLRNRDVLLSHTGFSLYGSTGLGRAGTVDYQSWLGILTVPREALDLIGATLDDIDVKYVTGGQVFWQPPVDGLRLGATYLRTSIDFHLTLDPAAAAQLVMLGLVPADFDGSLVVSQRPTSLWVASAEYIRGDWMVAAEYSRAYKRQRTSLPAVIPTFEEDAESFYGLASYRLSPRFEVGGYYSVHHLDADDRRGRGEQWTASHQAFQRDLAATLRLDINEHWLWKLEAHVIDGTADLPAADNPESDRTWGLFLFRTTVMF
jgi:hypothetical protein